MRGTARAGLLLALLLPAACAQPGPPEAAQVLEEVLAAHNASIAGVQGRPVAAASVPAQPASAPAAAPSPPRAGGTPPDAAGDLVGLTPDALRQQLGEPRLRRPEGLAEVWHYQASQCHLDLVLYPGDGPRAGLRVGFASARSVGTARRGEAACLRDIAREGGTRRAPATEQALAGA